jgi:hypothetical protein
MCSTKGTGESFAGARIFFDEPNAFLRIQSDIQMSPNNGTPQNSTSMTWK